MNPHEARARRLLDERPDYMPHSSFEEADAAEVILAPMPEGRGPASRLKPPSTLPLYLASLYSESELLGRDQEAHLFRKMNYLKFLAAGLCQDLDPARAKAPVLDEIERLREEALAVKNQIIRANLRLVVSIAKKRVGPYRDFFDLISDGNMSLIHAVEKFDFARGFKFSTYASWAIMNNLSRAIPKEKRRHDRFMTGLDQVFENAVADRFEAADLEGDKRQTPEFLQRILGQLSERERQIITGRFGLGGSDELTLERIGFDLGISKERVRQIEAKAHEKLRKFAMTA